MDKHFLFLSTGPIIKRFFIDSLSEVGIPEERFEFFDDRFGEFIADSRLSASLDDVLGVLHDDLGVTITILCTHQHTPFEEKLVRNAVRYLPNQCCYPTDVIMREISFGDFSSFAPLVRLFRDVPRDLMLTAGTYLRCGLDASLAANKLIVHRNTFNYRLNAFVAKTGLDIRDYHNALLLELYFDLGGDRA
ncbi:MAG: PucR family transcriptional regulator [Erysipelotrichaceae bacterium]|nr:PucR family transcriptional regulator [Erysipelotrichaceae bacterium]